MQSKGSGPLRVVVGTVPRTEGKISALKLALMQAMEKWVILSFIVKYASSHYHTIDKGYLLVLILKTQAC